MGSVISSSSDTAIVSPPMEIAASTAPTQEAAHATGLGGVLSDTISTLTTATQHHKAICADTSLPEAFHEAAYGALRGNELLQLIEAQLAQHDLRRPQEAQAALEACKKKAQLLEEIFEEVSGAPEAYRLLCYKKAVRRKGRESMVEVLAIGVIDDACSLAGDSALDGSTETEVERLQDLVQDLRKMEPSVPDDRPRTTFTNHGPGNQFNAPGGTQNNNLGSGNQFLGSTFHGEVKFGSGR